MTTDLRAHLDRLDTALAAATPGPWQPWTGTFGPVGADDTEGNIVLDYSTWIDNPHDAEQARALVALIVAAVNALPVLLAAVRAAADLADELAAPASIAAILKTHQFCEHTAGDGYSEPREMWAECSCGVQLYAWQQHYDEDDPRTPHIEFAAHVAVLAQESAASRLRTTLAAALTEGDQA